MKKTLIILFSFFSIAVSFAQKASQPSMHFFIHDNAKQFDALGGLQKIIQLQYNYETDKTPVDSIYDGKANKKLVTISNMEYISATGTFALFQKLMFVCKTDTLYSDMFIYAAYHSAYNIQVQKEHIAVENITPWFFRNDMPFAFWRNLIVNLWVETLALWLVLVLIKYPQKSRFLGGILLANIISLTVFHFGIMKLIDSAIGYFIGLVFIVLFESFFLWFFTRKAGTFGRMVLLVLFLNFIGLLVNGALQFFNQMFGAEWMTKYITNG